MLKNTTFKEKFAMLKSWMPEIVDSIKKDLRNEHLKKDLVFHKTYFNSKNPQKLTVDEMADAYSTALTQGDQAEHLGEYISNRWLLKNSEIYYFFEKELTAITPNFSDLEVLETDASRRLMDQAVSQFGPQRTYLFAVMNSVVFPKEVFDELHKNAEQETVKAKEDSIQDADRKSLDDLKQSYETQLARQSDKYEKKLAGLERKYDRDVEALKKQIVSLQRRLNDSK